MLLHLIRHPRLDIAPGICYGQSDIAVNYAHCLEVAGDLRRLLPANVGVVSSPLQRCQILAKMLHPAPVPDARLMEMHFGQWEMRAWDDIRRSEIDDWADDVIAYVPVGGESVLMMAHRVHDFLMTLPAAHSCSGNELALVSHSGPLSLILAYQLGMSAQDLAATVVHKRKSLDFGECVQAQIKLC
jgi:alpha-ribazole phosphatase